MLEHLHQGAELRQLLEAVLGQQARRAVHVERALAVSTSSVKADARVARKARSASASRAELSRRSRPRADVEAPQRLVQVAARPVHETRVDRLCRRR